MKKSDKTHFCECGEPIYFSAKQCRACANKTRFKKDDLLVTRRSIKIGIRGLPEYQLWKTIVLGRDGYKCRGCGITEKLDIHHLYKEFDDIIIEFLEKYKMLLEDKRTLLSLAVGWAEFWDIKNGVTVCRPCHEKCHRKELQLDNK